MVTISDLEQWLCIVTSLSSLSLKNTVDSVDCATFSPLQTLGKSGRVLKVYTDMDLRVAIGNSTWTFNPLCVTSIPANELTALNNTMGHNEREEMQRKFYTWTMTPGMMACVFRVI